jgi:hypothetical protein
MAMLRDPRTRSLAVLLAAALVALVSTCAVVVAAQAGRAAKAAALLPDLDQETPSDLRLRTLGPPGSRSYRLGFRSAVRNVGAGALVIRGNRWGAAMKADQVLHLVDGTEETIGGVGSIEYVESPDHRHWHYVGFDRYELRRVGSANAAVRDRKSGFCLGDRYRADVRLANAPAAKVYTGRCGLSDRSLSGIEEGISVGYGDAYSAFLEYQDLPLDGLPDGRYLLVHHVNADGRLRELSYANNSSSVLLDLRWRDEAPLLLILAQCPDSATCTARRS